MDPFESELDDGQLVVIRPRVVENADHVFGNLFQRLYYGVSRVGDLDATLADELGDSARQVETALQLLLDYVAPFPPSLERFAVADLGRSLAQRVEAAAALRVALSLPDDAAGALLVLVDPARLGRAFDLMAARLHPGGGASPRLGATVGVDGDASTAAVWVRLPKAAVQERTSIGELRWAVADKLIDIHGGALGEETSGQGDVLWRVSLPREL